MLAWKKATLATGVDCPSAGGRGGMEIAHAAANCEDSKRPEMLLGAEHGRAHEKIIEMARNESKNDKTLLSSG